MNENPNYFAIIPANVRYDKELTPNTKLLYGEITALCNQQGFCWATNDYFAKLYGVSSVSISKWVNQLKKNGYIVVEMNYKKGSKEILNRYIRIVNDPIKEKFNTPQRKVKDPIKEKFKDNNTFNNTNNNISSHSEESDRETLQKRFDFLWSQYPKGRKQGKESAFNSYKRAIKKGVTDETILKAINDYKQQIKLQKTEVQFIKQGGTWFNGKCWNDEYITQTKSSNKLEYVQVPKEYRT